MYHRDRFLKLTGIFLVLALALQVSTAFATEAVDPGKKTYLVKCAKCHRLYAPADYTDEQWGSWMDKMREKSHLSLEEYENISAYCASLRDKRQVKAQ